MIKVLDGSQGFLKIESEYKIHLTRDIPETILCRDIPDQFTGIGHPCEWCFRLIGCQYYCRQTIVVPYPFSEHLIDIIKQIWQDYILGESRICRVCVLKIHSITQTRSNIYDPCYPQ